MERLCPADGLTINKDICLFWPDRDFQLAVLREAGARRSTTAATRVNRHPNRRSYKYLLSDSVGELFGHPSAPNRKK